MKIEVALFSYVTYSTDAAENASGSCKLLKRSTPKRSGENILCLGTGVAQLVCHKTSNLIVTRLCPR